MRQIVLDTETTGLDPKSGHRIIEIGCVEMVDRRLTGNTYHEYIKPNREIDAGAMRVHGITNEFLNDKPEFKSIYTEFLNFVKGAELIIHNAAFDVGFIDHEFALLNPKYEKIGSHCSIIDTLKMARSLHPGQKNNLDALCKRYDINNSHRDLHGALLDSEILALVYLAMTSGQDSLFEDEIDTAQATNSEQVIQAAEIKREKPLRVIKASDDELLTHLAYLEEFEKS